jgi:AraC-like DNA-binding protein
MVVCRFGYAEPGETRPDFLKRGAWMTSNSKYEPGFFFDRVDHNTGSEPSWRRGRVMLVLVQKGAMIVSNGRSSSQLRAKECGLILDDGSDSITVQHNGQTQILRCLIPSKSVRKIDPSKGTLLPSKVFASDQLRTLFQLGLELSGAVSDANLHLRDAIGEAVLAAHIAVSADQSPQRLPSFIRNVCAYVNAHYREACDLDLLSEIAGVSKGHLTCEFRKHLGVSPVRYLWAQRTKRAAEAIRTTSLGLVEIAERCGFQSHFHLSREVKAFTGFSPRELRKNYSHELDALTKIAPVEALKYINTFG